MGSSPVLRPRMGSAQSTVRILLKGSYDMQAITQLDTKSRKTHRFFVHHRKTTSCGLIDSGR